MNNEQSELNDLMLRTDVELSERMAKSLTEEWRRVEYKRKVDAYCATDPNNDGWRPHELKAKLGQGMPPCVPSMRKDYKRCLQLAVYGALSLVVTFFFFNALSFAIAFVAIPIFFNESYAEFKKVARFNRLIDYLSIQGEPPTAFVIHFASRKAPLVIDDNLTVRLLHRSHCRRHEVATNRKVRGLV